MRLRDGCLLNFNEVSEYIKGENKNQLIKWGVQEHEIEKWICILMEEVGELSKAVLEGFPNLMLNESIQVATLSVKISEMILNKIKEGN